VIFQPDPENTSGSTDELEHRARLLGSRVMLGVQPDADEAIDLGVDLLIAGFDGPGVVALASLPPRSDWSDVEPLLRSALKEVNVVLPAPTAAGWELARYWATELERGGPQSHSRASLLWGLWQTLDFPPEVAALVEVMDAWEETLPQNRNQLESQLASLAPPIIEAADRALAGVVFGPPCSEESIHQAGALLGVRFPEPLRNLLLGGNGRFDKGGQWWVAWPLERIVQDNLAAWRERGLPRSLIAIGDDGSGDPFCLNLSGTGVRVVRWLWIESSVAEEGPGSSFAEDGWGRHNAPREAGANTGRGTLMAEIIGDRTYLDAFCYLPSCGAECPD
jgi:hypothetical protein